MLVVVSQIKAMAKAVGLRTSLDFCTALSESLQDVIIFAAKSAKADGRGTIKERDLPALVLEKKEG